MKITNRTPIPNRVYRRMVAWCCKQLPIPVSSIVELEIGTHSTGNSGDVKNGYFTHGGRQGLKKFKLRLWLQVENSQEPFSRDQIYTVAFYLAHVDSQLERSSWAGQGTANREANRIAERWEQQRAKLWTDWNRPDLRETVKPVNVGEVLSPEELLQTFRGGKPKKSRKQINAERAKAHLDKWERKLKLAKTKVTKYRRAVRRYVREGVLENAG